MLRPLPQLVRVLAVIGALGSLSACVVDQPYDSGYSAYYGPGSGTGYGRYYAPGGGYHGPGSGTGLGRF